jgi:hypothetical protein
VKCGGSGAVFEAPALVACLDDVAVVSEAIEQRCGHLGIAKNARPFAECEIRRDDDRRAFVEAADGVEQELPAGLREGQITKFVEDDKVQTGEKVSEPSLAAGASFGLKTVDQVDGREESPTRSGADAASCDGDRQVRFAGTGRSRDILPGIRRPKDGFSTGSILGMVLASR